MERRAHMFLHHEVKPSTSRSSSTLIFDRKPGNESSCSNSTQIVLPVASSNDSYQESTEAKSSEHHNGSSSLSLPTDFQKQRITDGLSQISQVSQVSQVKKENSSISYESVMTITEDVATKAHGFDLNEDLHNNNNIDSCSSVIHVKAKSGIPCSIPKAPLKFEGAQGWKGSAATSAFRPTMKLSKFDLNVSSEEDKASKKAERPSFDLNCVDNDTNEEFEFLPVTNSKPPMVDLNEDPSYTDKTTLISSNMRDNHNLTYGRPVYWTDLNPVQFFGHTQPQPLLMAAPPNMLQTLPTHNYSSNGQFFIGSNELHYPYTRDPRVHTVFPQMMNHGTLPSFTGTSTPHLMQVVHVQNPNEVMGSNVAVNGNMRDYTRQYLSPGKSLSQEEQMKQMKRREPDGGWSSFQIGGTRQFTSWN